MPSAENIRKQKLATINPGKPEKIQGVNEAYKQSPRPQKTKITKAINQEIADKEKQKQDFIYNDSKYKKMTDNFSKFNKPTDIVNDKIKTYNERIKENITNKKKDLENKRRLHKYFTDRDLNPLNDKEEKEFSNLQETMKQYDADKKLLSSLQREANKRVLSEEEKIKIQDLTTSLDSLSGFKNRYKELLKRKNNLPLNENERTTMKSLGKDIKIGDKEIENLTASQINKISKWTPEIARQLYDRDKDLAESLLDAYKYKDEDYEEKKIPFQQRVEQQEKDKRFKEAVKEYYKSQGYKYNHIDPNFENVNLNLNREKPYDFSRQDARDNEQRAISQELANAQTPEEQAMYQQALNNLFDYNVANPIPQNQNTEWQRANRMFGYEQPERLSNTNRGVTELDPEWYKIFNIKGE